MLRNIRSRLTLLHGMAMTERERTVAGAALDIVEDEARQADFTLTYRELIVALRDTQAIERNMTPEEATLHIVASVRKRR